MAALLVPALLTTACGALADGDRGVPLNVFAAASLAESFGALGRRFEQDNSDVDVRLNLAGSATLAQQIVEGAPADVFASANESTMETVVAAGRAARPAVFATNSLTIVVPAGNPRDVRSLADLTGAGLTVVVCAPEVPCGTATEQVERSAGAELTPASEEQDVKAVLNKVVAGEADAGLVYVTDATAAAGKVDSVAITEAAAAVNSYPIAAVEGSAQAEAARRFVDFVLGSAGREELGRAGFGTP
ncbi:molybdate transport system substrate-binding protein [Amycolatopsis marina]|uniref:Molybdate transport system substrate-binding protein n=1 Tax=Amycolatopsis marina TaxID=490629 RepID=A0A1I1CIP9_9PSEU|nr:molybdate ABC transporter substrate-binding protein [Amycolatopsis marina]SFB62357.1 molybdate transport system substrate-binding protein [Amycolatopsis marina]